MIKCNKNSRSQKCNILIRVALLILNLNLYYFVYSQSPKIIFDNFTTEEGLSNNYINCILQDQKGWIWIGTGSGIERFDGVNFKYYPFYSSDSLADNMVLVRSFYEDTNGNLYACAEEFGMVKYNREKDQFEKFKICGQPVLSDISFKGLAEDKTGNLWAATKDGVYKIDIANQEVTTYRHGKENDNTVNGNYIRILALDNRSNLWIGTKTGLDLFNPEKNLFVHYSQLNNLLNDDILSIHIDTLNRVWIGTSNNGIIIINQAYDQFTQFIPDKSDDRSKKVNVIFQDKENKFWIGARSGLFLYDEGKNKILKYQNNPLEVNSLVHNSVVNIFQDTKGDMWIGTRSGLSYIAKEKQIFENYIAIPNNDHYLNNNEIYSIWIDNMQKIWIGTESGGVNILDRESGTFKYLTGNILSNDCVKSINSLGDGKVLIGTLSGGLNIYNEKTGKITWLMHNEKDPQSISSNTVWDISIDKENKIWLGTVAGLERFNPVDETFEHYPEFKDLANGVTWIGIDPDNDLWIGTEKITVFRPGYGIINVFREKGRDLFVDSKGRYWIMTNDEGIVLFDKYIGAKKVYGKKEGLACNLAYCMLEDSKGNLWISTANGLSRFNPEKEEFTNFYNHNGLLGNHFNYGAAFKSQNGDLLFGGKKGLSILNPEKIYENSYIPPVYITNIKVLNKTLKVDNGENSILKKSITETDLLEIPYKHNIINFEFVALNYTNSDKNNYRYKLENFDKEWTETLGKGSATYTNLNPGKYVFKVIASNDRSYWNEKGTSISMVILPPLYKQFWFKALVFIVFVAIIYFILSVFIKKKELAKNFEFEKLKAQKMHELDSFKLNLFTNISHEIKTPLTLIMSPLSKILKNNYEDSELKENLLLMEKNTKHLMKLITQLLDYRKFQEGKLKIELKRGNIVKFCNEIFISFETLMKENGIVYYFGSVQNKIITSFDPEKLRIILNNLISNAIQYNKQAGSIKLLISMVIEQNNDTDENQLRFVKIELQDTGIGISEKELQNIFKRYYNKSYNKNQHSTGIGLAFAKELIELHNGKVFVDSKEGKGSTFTVMLPYDENTCEDTSGEEINEMDSKKFINTKEFKLAQKSKKILLLVEDNEDVLHFLKLHFNHNYIVLCASNGNDGLDLALKTIPDIIVSDIMMHGLDGMALCEKIKKDERTSHIPIILLSALSSKEHIKDGLTKGADEFITKPFDIDLLQTKIENLLKLRRSLLEKYSKLNLIHPSHVVVKTLDDKFLEKAVKYIEKNIDNPELNIDKLVEIMTVSRTQLYRKIKALTNMSVNEFINDIRLKRAEQIFSDKKISVSEVAYMVGFNELSYFGKCFKKKYGLTPSEYNQRKHDTTLL